MPRDPDDPWGAGNKLPPDLDKILTQGIDHFKKFLPGGSPSRFLIIVIVFFLATLIWSALYTVPSDSVAVVQRFGKYVHYVPPGLHLKFPLGIDSATIVPVKRQLKQEFGFSTPGATDPYQSARKVENIRGLADAKATEIYALAYNKNPQSVAFYEFTRTMQSYPMIISNSTTLVLSTDNDLFKFLKGVTFGQKEGATMFGTGDLP